MQRVNMLRKIILFVLLFVFIGISEKPVKYYDPALIGEWRGVMEANSNNWLRFGVNGKCFVNRGNTAEIGNWANIGDDSLYFCLNSTLYSEQVLQEFSGDYKIIEDTLILHVKINFSSKDFIFLVDEKYYYIPMVKCKTRR